MHGVSPNSRSEMSHPNNQFSLSGRRVKEWRKAKGLSQRELGALVGVEGATISRLESGHRRLTVDWLSRIAEALNCDPAEIVLGSPRPDLEEDGLERVMHAIEAHWRSLGTEYARETFTEDLQRHFPRLKL